MLNSNQNYCIEQNIQAHHYQYLAFSQSHPLKTKYPDVPSEFDGTSGHLVYLVPD